MRRRSKIVLIIVGSVAALVVAAGLVLPSAATRSSAATSIGSASWSDAVVQSRSSRTLMVQADVEGMDDRFDCGPAVRPHVTETATAVRVRVEVLNRPLPPGVECGAPAFVTVPATVRLKTALGDRVVEDATDHRSHQVLVVDGTPAARAVAAPFVRKATGWTSRRAASPSGGGGRRIIRRSRSISSPGPQPVQRRGPRRRRTRPASRSGRRTAGSGRRPRATRGPRPSPGRRARDGLIGSS